MLPSLAALAAADASTRPTLISNVKLSSPKIALNEVERIEFTTMQREVENVDIAAAVANALRLGAGSQWLLIGKPVVTEMLNGTPAVDPSKPPSTVVRERLRPVTVVFTMLARTPGDLVLPDVPLTWLTGNQVARLGTVVVDSSIKVGSVNQELPREVSGVAGYAWNAKFTDIREHLQQSQIEMVKDHQLVHVQKNLTLEFIGGTLAQATLLAPGLTLDQARLEFLKHWGIPQIEEPAALTWVLGWTRITASMDGNAATPGIVLNLVRDDVRANLTHSQVSAEVFGVLDGPEVETPEQAEARRAKEANDALERPAPQK
jgi:hypothetical protein